MVRRRAPSRRGYRVVVAVAHNLVLFLGHRWRNGRCVVLAARAERAREPPHETTGPTLAARARARLLWPDSRGDDLLVSSPDPLVSVISDGDRGVGNGGVLRSRSLLIDERRLEMLRRLARPVVVWTDGGREGDFEGVSIDTGDAKCRLSVDGDRPPSSESRRSLMKSLTMDSDDLRRGRPTS